MRNIWKTGPDSLTITIEQNVQFQVGIYHEKFHHDKIKMADLRPLLIVKFSHYHDPLNIFLCFAIVECALVSNDFHFKTMIRG